MSLLSGIKFVPKSERKAESVDRKTEEKHQHKDKKEKKRKHHKDRKHKDKAKDRDHRHGEEDESSSGSEIEEDVRPKKKERTDWRQDYGDNQDEDFNFEDWAAEQRRTKEKETKPKERPNDRHVQDLHVVPATTQPVDTQVKTNRNVAELLKNRLKASTTKALDPAEVSASIQMGASSDINESIKYSKDYVLLKNQYQKLQREQGKAPDGKQSKNVLSALGGDDDIDKIYSSNILRLGGRYKGTELLSTKADGSGFNEEDDIDMSLFQQKGSAKDKLKDKAGKGKGKEAVDEASEAMKRSIQESMREQNRMVATLSQCAFCFSNAKFPRHLVIGQSENLILRLKSHQYALADGHFELVPRYHAASYLACDEDTRAEIGRTLQCLQRMFDRLLGKSLVVMETAIRLHQRPHACIEVMPIEMGAETDVQMFFREAFLTCDEEWAQHKKLIELSDQKPLAAALPAHFPYLHVSWLTAEDPPKTSCSGYVHPVENDSSVKHSFCYDIMAGILEEDEFRMRKGRPFSETKERENVVEWQKRWKEYDWTQYLAEELEQEE